MRRVAFMTTALSTILICGLIYAQEAKEKENLEYDKLKVLEPLIGTWQIEWTKDETGAKRQMKVEVSWSETKKMIRQQHQSRTAERGAELADAEWNKGILRYYAWNHNTKRIEQVDISERFGWVVTREVKPLANGVLEMPAISGTHKATDGFELVTYTATKDSLNITRSNRTDDEGNPKDDFSYTMQRVGDK